MTVRIPHCTFMAFTLPAFLRAFFASGGRRAGDARAVQSAGHSSQYKANRGKLPRNAMLWFGSLGAKRYERNVSRPGELLNRGWRHEKGATIGSSPRRARRSRRNLEGGREMLPPWSCFANRVARRADPALCLRRGHRCVQSSLTPHLGQGYMQGMCCSDSGDSSYTAAFRNSRFRRRILLRATVTRLASLDSMAL